MLVCHLCLLSIEVSPCLGRVLQLGCLLPHCWTWRVLVNFGWWSLLLQTVHAALELIFSFSSHCFFHFLSFFFHGPCLLYCTFKIITKSPKIPPLKAYRSFHFNFRVIIYFETIFMRICFWIHFKMKIADSSPFIEKKYCSLPETNWLYLWVCFGFLLYSVDLFVLSFVNVTVLIIAVWQIIISLLQLYFSILVAVCWLLWISCLFTSTLKSAHWHLWNDLLGPWVGCLWVCQSNLDSQMWQVLLDRFSFLFSLTLSSCSTATSLVCTP